MKIHAPEKFELAIPAIERLQNLVLRPDEWDKHYIYPTDPSQEV